METENSFKESQKFTQRWIWLILIGLAAIASLGFIQQIIFKKEFGNNPGSDKSIIIFTILSYCLLLFFRVIKLTLEISSFRIKLRFFPFFKKEIQWEEVKSAKVVNYGFIGYGIRLGGRYGTVYNIDGKYGLSLKLKNGKRLVIGTQKERELKKALEKFQPNSVG